MKDNIRIRSYGFTMLVLVVLLILMVGITATIGSASISTIDVYRVVASKIPVLGELVDSNSITPSQHSIIWSVRLPRLLLGVIVGAGLSISGASFQGLLKNPMADPYILGISSGAALGAAIAIILKLEAAFLGFSGISILAFVGALIAVTLVYNIGRIRSQVPVTTLLLAGVAVGQFLTAITSLLMVIYNRDMTKIIYWTLGSLAGKGWNPITTMSVPIIAAMVILLFFSRDINIMLTGEESAKSLGVNVERIKVYILLLGTFITSMAVSISGIIGFVGLIIPHIVRLIVGPDHRILLPASAVVGSIFMVFTDTIARTVISPMEIPVGIITAIFGGPFFIYLLRSKKKAL
ncbi:FecCD family ABC transporter permease [Gudongella sp. SC589]|jgi:iron complex transport system permease protein|uniref:FecCD family ABC transporter permease n=1 Tax=Gudongella sp. SC589 TaxID=3385990 RepID=UPI003904B552